MDRKNPQAVDKKPTPSAYWRSLRGRKQTAAIEKAATKQLHSRVLSEVTPTRPAILDSLHSRVPRAALLDVVRLVGLLHLVDGSSCWSVRSADGLFDYPSLRLRTGRWVEAYRWLWEQANGPVPSGRVLDHLCENKRCVNLAHLEPVTRSENVKRSKPNGRHRG